MPRNAWVPLALVLPFALSVGCEMISQVDRSKIPGGGGASSASGSGGSSSGGGTPSTGGSTPQGGGGSTSQGGGGSTSQGGGGAAQGGGGAAQGGGGAGGGQGGSGQGGAGGGMACGNVTECPDPGECAQRTCDNGFCGVTFDPVGTLSATQTADDCHKNQCDGAGHVVDVVDNTDLPLDGNACTNDICTTGTPSHTNVPAGASPVPPPPQVGCPSGLNFCDGAGHCVGCNVNGDCTGGKICPNHTCVTPGCTDGIVDLGETDVDCGGATTCARCADGKVCAAGTDCTSGVCNASLCVAAGCTDGIVDLGETDVDCGGTTACPRCAIGKICTVDGDCGSGRCQTGLCVEALVISEVQSRGNSGNDEFVEIYNPTANAVTFDATWTLSFRNAETGCGASYVMFATGGGQSIPSHGHLLIATAGGTNPYNGTVVPDITYPPPASQSMISDAGSLVLHHGANVADAVCFAFSQTTQDNLVTTCTGFICEGTPATNPHDGTASSNGDLSIERKPGGAAGSTQDTNDSATDFAATAASDPQDLASTPVP